MQSVSLRFGLVLYLQSVNEKEKKPRLSIVDCGFRVQAHRVKLTFAFQERLPLKYRPELFRLKCPLDSLSVEMRKTTKIKACTKQSVQDDIKIKSLGQVRKLTVCEASLPS